MSKYENKVFINQYLGIWAYGYVNGFTGTEAVYRIVKSFVMEEFNKEEKLNNIIENKFIDKFEYVNLKYKNLQ